MIDHQTSHFLRRPSASRDVNDVNMLIQMERDIGRWGKHRKQLVFNEVVIIFHNMTFCPPATLLVFRFCFWGYQCWKNPILGHCIVAKTWELEDRLESVKRSFKFFLGFNSKYHGKNFITLQFADVADSTYSPIYPMWSGECELVKCSPGISIRFLRNFSWTLEVLQIPKDKT